MFYSEVQIIVKAFFINYGDIEIVVQIFSGYEILPEFYRLAMYVGCCRCVNYQVYLNSIDWQCMLAAAGV